MTKSTRKANRKLAQRPFNPQACNIGDACYCLSRASYMIATMVINLRQGYRITWGEAMACKHTVMRARQYREVATLNGRKLP